MLINKTIDKPVEKFELLIDYVERNNLWDSIFFMEDEYGNITRKTLYLPERRVCNILRISLKTLKNWSKRSMRERASLSDYGLDRWLRKSKMELNSIGLDISTGYIRNHSFYSSSVKEYKRKKKIPNFDQVSYTGRSVRISDLFAFLLNELDNKDEVFNIE